MNAWIIYDESNIARNQGYIDRWFAACKEKEIALALLTTAQIAFGIENNVRFIRTPNQNSLPDFVVMRTMHPLLSHHLEAMGVPVFNNAEIADICNDKQKTHALLCGRVPMMDTAFVDARSGACPFPYPVVVKPSHGCGGLHVQLAQNDAEYRAAIQSVYPDTAVVQRLCDTPGRDLRVYMLGERIVQPMLRQSISGFRSNFGLGGTASKYSLSSDEEKLLRKACEPFHFGFVGVDFIFHQGHLVFNEIEDAVGARMLYIHTQIDIVREYLMFILARI